MSLLSYLVSLTNRKGQGCQHPKVLLLYQGCCVFKKLSRCSQFLSLSAPHCSSDKLRRLRGSFVQACLCTILPPISFEDFGGLEGYRAGVSAANILSLGASLSAAAGPPSGSGGSSYALLLADLPHGRKTAVLCVARRCETPLPKRRRRLTNRVYDLHSHLPLVGAASRLLVLQLGERALCVFTGSRYGGVGQSASTRNHDRGVVARRCEIPLPATRPSGGISNS